MEGFLPLIEAILAFALTMVALTTAVSVITGVAFRLLRSRASGLREMMTYFFRNEVIPLLERIEPPATRDSTAASKPTGDVFDTSPRGSYETRIDFLVDMTLLPTVIEGEETAREDMLKEADVRPTRSDPSKTPICDAIAGLFAGAAKEAGESKPEADATEPSRAHRLESWLRAHPPVSWLLTLWWQIATAWWWAIPRRASLRFGLDTLTEKEFVSRLRMSRLANALVEKLSPEEYADRLEALRRSFVSMGAAYSEKFSRSARILTIIAGFSLAFFGNVDSIALINSYMSDPELRNQIIQQQESILTSSASGETTAPSSPEPANKKIEEKGKQIDEKIREIQGLIDSVPDGPARDSLEAALDSIEKTKEEIQVTADEAQRGYAEIQQTIGALTETFPIGWTLYPNCEPSIDPRCLRFEKSRPELVEKFETERGMPWSVYVERDEDHRPSVFPCYTFSISFGDELKSISWLSWLSKLEGQFPMPGVGGVCELDNAQYKRWFLGVVLTGLLLGLGTPFWIAAVNGFMRARNLMRGSGAEGNARRDGKGKDDETTERESIVASATLARGRQTYRIVP